MSTKKKNGTAKGDPIPVRLHEEEKKFVDELAASTGLKKVEIIRRACRYAVPKFISHEVDILQVKAAA